MVAQTRTKYFSASTTSWSDKVSVSPKFVRYCTGSQCFSIGQTTQISTFHLKNRDAQRELKDVWHGKLLAYSHKPVYLGISLDRCLTYKDHIDKTKSKTGPGTAFSRSWRTPIGEQTPELSAPQPWLCVSPLLSTRPQSGADHRMLQ